MPAKHDSVRKSFDDIPFPARARYRGTGCWLEGALEGARRGKMPVNLHKSQFFGAVVECVPGMLPILKSYSMSFPTGKLSMHILPAYNRI